MTQPHNNEFQHPPFFVRGSIDETGRTVQLVDEDGHVHTLHIDEALEIIYARLHTERYGAMFINTPEFEAIPA